MDEEIRREDEFYCGNVVISRSVFDICEMKVATDMTGYVKDYCCFNVYNFQSGARIGGFVTDMEGNVLWNKQFVKGSEESTRFFMDLASDAVEMCEKLGRMHVENYADCPKYEVEILHDKRVYKDPSNTYPGFGFKTKRELDDLDDVIKNAEEKAKKPKPAAHNRDIKAKNKEEIL